MAWDNEIIQRYKAIARSQFTTVVMSDYNLPTAQEIVSFTDKISDIYKHLYYKNYKSIIIFLPLDNDTILTRMTGASPRNIQSFENLAPLFASNIVIQLNKNGSVDVSIDFTLDIMAARQTAIIYELTNPDGTEVIYGKTQKITLLPPPGADSYFASPTYKDLETALEDYDVRVARHSNECPHLKDVWVGRNKIFLRPKPEHLMRDSLTYFLKGVRGVEARPEQVVDKSHPVDIKVTWTFTQRLALIEIKWLGQSLNVKTGKITSDYTQKKAIKRAREGAAQLVDYLDENYSQAPTHVTKAYLVIFDVRREKYDSKAFTITRNEGLKFLNEDIQYDPEYHLLRSDFAKPYRFFMNPKV